jgi:hypothetical protein
LDLKGWLIENPVFFQKFFFVYFPFPDMDRISIKKWKLEKGRLNDDYCFFFSDFLVFAILNTQTSLPEELFSL